MVTSVTSFGRSGLYDWLIQRIGGAVMAAFAAYTLEKKTKLAPHEVPPSKREPLSKPAIAFAAVLWVVAVAFVTEPLLAHAAQLGRTDQRHTYRFTAADGWARPLGHEAAHVPPIQLPAESRLALIKSGSEVELTTVEGRFGMWVYNDAPLRHLADFQGVR